MGELEGRVIAIAGAAGGLGPSVSRRLAEEGATIAATDVSAGAARRLRGDLVLSDERYDGRAVDLLDAEAARGAGPRTCASDSAASTPLLHLVGGWRGGEPIADAPLSRLRMAPRPARPHVQHTTRAFRDALAASDAWPLRPRLLLQAQRPDGDQRLLRRRQGGRRELDARPRRLLQGHRRRPRT